MPKPKYFIETWDADLEDFTPQKGVRRGPYTLFGLRRAIRKLQAMGYDCRRYDCSVSVTRVPEEDEDEGLFRSIGNVRKGA